MTTPKRKLAIVPCTRAEAQTFIARLHRHCKPQVGEKFCIACADVEDGVIVGVAAVGRPVARSADDGWTLEVTRLCTDGTPNACSMLYAAAWRAARAMGYLRLQTYTLASEPGDSLRGAGWKVIGKVKGRSWHRESRPRIDTHPLQDKLKWGVEL